ncbi:hypothetical protein [Micromonospora sp. DT231]
MIRPFRWRRQPVQLDRGEPGDTHPKPECADLPTLPPGSIPRTCGDMR